MLRSKTHETAVLLMGTSDTSNYLAEMAMSSGGDQSKGYDHVVMLQVRALTHART
jgi:hypothetical protein